MDPRDETHRGGERRRRALGRGRGRAGLIARGPIERALRASGWLASGLLASGLLASESLAACGYGGVAPAGPRDTGAGDADGGVASDGGRAPDGGAGSRDAGPPTPPRDLGPAVAVEGGEVEGDWCGRVDVRGTVTVPPDRTLTLCAGADVTFAARAALVVRGALRVLGTAAEPVTLRAAPPEPGGSATAPRWAGLRVTGRASGAHLAVRGAAIGVETLAGADAAIGSLDVADCDFGLRLGGGGAFDRARVVGGGSVTVTGGVLRMRDAVVDLEHPEVSPDCLVWSGGGAVLEHVHVTGCHCPVHIAAATEEFVLTGSLLDGAAVAVMIRDARATFRGNAFIGTGTAVQDIGGGISADVAGNYWEAPRLLSTSAPAQFRGADDRLATRPPDVGPRPE